MLRTRLLAGALLVVAFACGGQSESRRQGADAAAQMAAGARTLEALHRGRLTRQFAEGAFVNYREQLTGLDAKLPDGELRDQWRRAQPAVERPCMEGGCNWQAQVRALDDAAETFRRAGGG